VTNTKNGDGAALERGRDVLIDRLYEVAMDPARYEELLDHWEALTGPLRESSDGTESVLLNDSVMENHIARADRFIDMYADTRDDPGERVALINSFEMAAAFLIEEDLTIGALNGAAQEVLGIEVGKHVSTLPVESQDLPVLSEQMQQMLQGRGAAMSLFRVRAAEGDRFIVFRIRQRTLRDGARTLVVASSELSWPSGFGGIIQEAFGFTDAEVTVVRMLVECCSVKEIAEQRGRSVDTIRAQIKSILSKTETRSQVELLRLILSMMDMTGFAVAGPSHAAAWAKEAAALGQAESTVKTHVTYTADGRKLSYLTWGDEAGKPCLWMHVDIGFSRWPVSAEQAAKNMGLRIICPIRNGYDGSDPLSPKGDFARGLVDDIICVLKAENIERCSVITQATDLRINAHMERFYPGIITGIVACGGMPPFDSPELYEGMGKWHRILPVTARYTPHLLGFMVKSGFLMAKKYGQRKFLTTIFNRSQADIDQFDDPEIWEAIATGIQICLSDTHSAHKSFTRQIIEEISDWYEDFLNMEGKFPVHFLNGTHDPQATLELVEPFLKNHPWVTSEIVEGAGQILFFSHWEKALKKVNQF